ADSDHSLRQLGGMHTNVLSKPARQTRPDAGESFFFQAEDGIRDATVTGVQTCALPIWFFRSKRLAAPPSHDYSKESHGRRPAAEIGRASCRERVWISVVAGSVITKNVDDQARSRIVRTAQYYSVPTSVVSHPTTRADHG